MDLTGIIAISGKPGLYKVVGQGKNSLIVESLQDRKRMPAHSSNKISSLEDITMYTASGDKSLAEVLKGIYEKESGAACISHKEDIEKLKGYLEGILPDYDRERVYTSDIQKLFQWYNLLQASGELKERMEAAAEAEKESAAAAEAEKPAKATKAKKAADAGEPTEATETAAEEKPKKAAAKKPAEKKAAPAKAAAPKAAAKPKAAAANSKAAAAPKKTGKGKV
jgi:hypothetical protein